MPSGKRAEKDLSADIINNANKENAALSVLTGLPRFYIAKICFIFRKSLLPSPQKAVSAAEKM